MKKNKIVLIAIISLFLLLVVSFGSLVICARFFPKVYTGNNINYWKKGNYYSCEESPIPSYELLQNLYDHSEFYYQKSPGILWLVNQPCFDRAYCLELTFDDTNYESEKRRIDEETVFEEREEVYANGRLDLPKNHFILGDYDVRVVKKNDENSSYGYTFCTVCCNDNANIIRYCIYNNASLGNFESEKDFLRRIEFSLCLDW